MQAVHETIALEESVPKALVSAILEMARRPGNVIEEEISRDAFIEGIRQLDCSAFATITTCNVVNDSSLVKPKTNGISGAIMKFSVSQVCINASYAAMVNNRIGKITEPGEFMKEFEAQQRTWGDRVMVDGKPRGLVTYKDKTYLEMAHLRTLSQYTRYFLNGKLVDYNDIKEFFRPKKESGRQPLPEDQKVQWRTIDVENIVDVTITPNCEPRLTYRYRLV